MAKDIVPSLDKLHSKVDSLYKIALSGVPEASRVTLQQLPLNRNQIDSLAIEPLKTESVRLDGVYRILKIDATDNVGIWLELKGEEYSFSALASKGSLTSEMIDAIQKATWEKSEVYLEINAEEIMGEKTNAIVLGVGSTEHMSLFKNWLMNSKIDDNGAISSQNLPKITVK